MTCPACDGTAAKVIAENLPRACKRALFTSDGQGNYSSSTFHRLMGWGLVDRNFRFTELGKIVRQYVRFD